MNESKAIEYLSETFRFDKYDGSDGNYELISNYWGMKFNVRIREFTIFLANTSGGAKCSIDADEDETTIARELTAFIGEVLKDESSHYVYDGTNGILAWPYNCNFAYIKYIKQCFDMNPNESDYEYMGRKLGKNLDNSRKPVDSSMQGQERGIQDIMDEYGCSREEAIDIMNSEVTSGCHGKAKKKNKKEIKSSLVDEFEDSYCNASNEWPEEERHSYEDSFINGFAKDHGITYDETKKMLDELQDKWYKDADNAGIVDIYSSTRRNITNINRIFG